MAEIVLAAFVLIALFIMVVGCVTMVGAKNPEVCRRIQKTEEESMKAGGFCIKLGLTILVILAIIT